MGQIVAKLKSNNTLSDIAILTRDTRPLYSTKYKAELKNKLEILKYHYFIFKIYSYLYNLFVKVWTFYILSINIIIRYFTKL